jgi:hypothetical protein
VLVTALLVMAALAGTGLDPAALAAERRERLGWVRATASYTLALGLLALAGVVAAALVAVLPSPLAGLLGVVPLVRGVQRLTSLRFVPELAHARAVITDLILAYVALVATRAGSEIALAALLLAIFGALTVLLGRRLPARLPPPLAAWTLVGIGVYLLADNHALALFGI